MFKLIAILLFTVMVAAAHGEHIEQGNDIACSSNFSVQDNNVQLIKYMYENNIYSYDKQIEIYETTYHSSLETISLNAENLANILLQTRTHLEIWGLLNSTYNICINLYRPLIPTVENISSDAIRCVETAEKQLNGMLKDLRATRNDLGYYYNYTFAKQISNCSRAVNYTACEINAINNATSFTNANQNMFNEKLYTAQLLANINIRNALTCGFVARNHALSIIAEAKNLINRCKECNWCYEYAIVKKDSVCKNCKTISNPFYGRNVIGDRLTLKFTN